MQAMWFGKAETRKGQFMEVPGEKKIQYRALTQLDNEAF